MIARSTFVVPPLGGPGDKDGCRHGSRFPCAAKGPWRSCGRVGRDRWARRGGNGRPSGPALYATIQRPAATVAFLDARVTESEPTVLRPDEALGRPSAGASRFAARHGQGGNLSFCDGHAAWFAGTNVVETRPGRNRGYAIFPDGQILWTADPNEDPGQEDD